MGVPTLACKCAVCASTDPHDSRTRPSIALEYGGHRVLIDTGPDFRQQAIREGIDFVDAVLYTHSHADHILGLDDLRPLSFLHRERPLPLYTDATTAAVLRRIFDYTFNVDSKYPTSARVEIMDIGEGVDLFGARFRRLAVQHGNAEINGFRFGSAAYLTDMSDIPEATLAQLQGLEVLVLDALRHSPHPTHSHLEKSLDYVKKLQPKYAYFTHMSHEISHAAVQAALPANVFLAHDGLHVEFEIA